MIDPSSETDLWMEQELRAMEVAPRIFQINTIEDNIISSLPNYLLSCRDDWIFQDMIQLARMIKQELTKIQREIVLRTQGGHEI